VRRGALAAVLLAFAAAQAPAQTPSFPSEAKRVTVDVVVVDEKGQPLAGLTKADFVVEEDGVRQEILDFEAVDVSAAGHEAATERPRVSTNAVREGPGRAFLFVLDDLNLSPGSAEGVKKAVASFLETHARDGDRVTLSQTSGGSWWTGLLPRDRDDLLASLKALKGRRAPATGPERMSDYEAMLIDTQRDREAIAHVTKRLELYGLLAPELTTGVVGGDAPPRATSDLGTSNPMVWSLAADVYAQAKERNRRTLRSLERALLAVTSGRSRRSVILVSDGFVQDEALTELRTVRDAARRANAVLYFLDARGLMAPDFGGADVAMVVNSDRQEVPDPLYMSRVREYEAAATAGAVALAADSGGFSVRNTNDLVGGLGRISRESRTFYLLGYEPSNRKSDGKFRKIQVKVGRPGARVSARAGYYPGAARAEAPEGGLHPEVRRALDAINEERGIPMRLASYVLGRAAEDRATVLLTAEVDPAALELQERDGLAKGALESFSTLVARDSGQAGGRERQLDLAFTPEVRRRMAWTWVPVSHSFELPPGRYQATFAVRNPRTGALGSVRHDFDVPAPQSLHLTTPVITDTLQRGSGAMPAVPIPIARRTFAVGSRVVCALGVEGARPDPQSGSARVLITYEVLRGDGSVVARTAPTALAPNEQGSFSSSFNLTLNRPGRYELRLRARDDVSGEEASAEETFEVEAAPRS
jgi:VWFA-related protein